jgi:hypothetical protein
VVPWPIALALLDKPVAQAQRPVQALDLLALRGLQPVQRPL